MQHDAQEMLRFVLTRLQTVAQQAVSSKSTTSGGVLSQNGGVTMEDDDTTPSLLHATAFKSRKRLIPRKDTSVRKMLKPSATQPVVKLTHYFSRVGSSKAPQLTAKNKPVKKTGNTENNSIGDRWSTARKRLDFITEMFQGELVSQIHCYECDSLTRRAEPFLDISVPVSSQSLPGFPASSTPVKGETKDKSGSYQNSDLVGPFSLSWALSQFCYREKLYGENKYRCENCRHLVEAEKTVLFGHLPLMMTIHLNRFATQISYGMLSSISVSKIGGNIAVPPSLCFSAWCTQDCQDRDMVYHLFAVVFHMGGSCSSGHYTACVRGEECQDLAPPFMDDELKEKGSWFYFDDEIVEVLTLEEVLEMLSPLTSSTLTAYILFYTLNK